MFLGQGKNSHLRRNCPKEERRLFAFAMVALSALKGRRACGVIVRACCVLPSVARTSVALVAAVALVARPRLCGAVARLPVAPAALLVHVLRCRLNTVL